MKAERQLLGTYRGVGVMGKWLGPPHDEMPRCGAKTRSGHLCGHYAMKNGRCRFHGGKSTGAKKPHRPIKHGFYTKEAIADNKYIRKLIEESEQSIADLESHLTLKY